MTSIRFGTDGWRGIFAEDFTYENVRKVAYAIARYVVRSEQPANGVLVGYDTRFGSERFARVAADTIAMTGTPVWLAADACPTPAISLLVRQRGAAGGIQITASHNPYNWNGVKYKASYGSSASPAIVARIEGELGSVLQTGVPPLPPRNELIQSIDVRTPYLETLDKLVDWDKMRAANFRFVVDPMHGSGRGLLRDLFARHGVPCDEIRGTRDPLFGGVNPEPIEPHVEALRRAVVDGKYDAGFALDGDADRIGAIDRNGTFVTPHQIFSILLWHLAGTRKISGDVAKTFSTTKMVDKIAAQKGPRSWYNRARMESAFTSLMSAGRRVDLVGSERIRERVQEFYASAYEIIDADIESIDAVWRDCHEALFEGAERFMDIARSEVQARTRLISISRTLRRPVRTFKRRRLTKRFRDMTSDVPPTDRSS